ncbi:MAG: transcription termination factor NusA [Candidatus Gracilibacteria bacterium]|nr:transcription termination factor NusA [Candidatus Gracilibacteria bacterium]
MLDLKQIEQAVNIISVEKKIPKEKLIEIIEAAIKTAYKKDYSTKDEEVNVKLDLVNYNLEITVEKTVVKEVTNPSTEISFEELGDDAGDYSEGDIIELDVTDEINADDGGESFGRIASQAARQVIIQKIGDSEKEKIYDLFEGKEGQVINMKVEMVEGGKVVFDYNGNQVVLPKSEQVARDVYTPGARFFLYVAEVSKSETGAPKVVLSRKRPEIVTAIFAENVSEIGEGIISIDNVVRQPGVKTKILVSTTFDEIDPVGTLIGQKGIRVKGVMDELSGEKIDIIANRGDVREILKKSLSPAEVIRVDVDEENESAICYILPTERAKAVGKNGLNVNLASKLTGYRISIEDIEVKEEK